jgi:hypothetical protein
MDAIWRFYPVGGTNSPSNRHTQRIKAHFYSAIGRFYFNTARKRVLSACFFQPVDKSVGFL